MTQTMVSRWLRGFDANGELKAEYRLSDSWTVERLRILFETGDDDQMFDSYPVGPLQAGLLGEDVEQNLVSCNLEFFLEADREG